MSDRERTGFRSLVYSGWHRVDRTRRLIGAVRAALLKHIDIDSCEYCPYCKDPLALIETERTARMHPKNAPVTARLAQMAGIPAYSVAYDGDIERTRCGQCGAYAERGEIRRFVMRQIQPPDPWNRLMPPQEYAEFLLSLRTGHDCRGSEVTCTVRVSS